ncbi:unnamed protein product, partial [Pylaiella littoralis]
RIVDRLTINLCVTKNTLLPRTPSSLPPHTTLPLRFAFLLLFRAFRRLSNQARVIGSALHGQAIPTTAGKLNPSPVKSIRSCAALLLGFLRPDALISLVVVEFSLSFFPCSSPAREQQWRYFLRARKTRCPRYYNDLYLTFHAVLFCSALKDVIGSGLGGFVQLGGKARFPDCQRGQETKPHQLLRIFQRVICIGLDRDEICQ